VTAVGVREGRILGRRTHARVFDGTPAFKKSHDKRKKVGMHFCAPEDPSSMCD
jgi:hypothetical protein